MKIEILYEDENIVAINKPTGLVVHSDGRTNEPTVVDWILENYPEIKYVGENMGGIERPGIVHRLDRDTSGVLIIAKNQESFEHLKEQFKERLVEKKYNAFVYGKLKEKEGIIDRPIGRSASDFRKKSAQRGAKGELREAITEYKVLNENDDVSFLEVKPKTGRTHQIRVHFKAIHHPIVCDSIYAPKGECLLGLNRLALHASSVSLDLIDGNKISIDTPLPEEFENLINNFWGVDKA